MFMVAYQLSLNFRREGHICMPAAVKRLRGRFFYKKKSNKYVDNNN